jgi:hypothetical protein
MRLEQAGLECGGPESTTGWYRLSRGTRLLRRDDTKAQE